MNIILQNKHISYRQRVVQCNGVIVRHCETNFLQANLKNCEMSAMSHVAYFVYGINGLNGGMPLDFQMHVCLFFLEKKKCAKQKYLDCCRIVVSRKPL